MSIADLPGEVWRVIEGHPDYHVSNMGRIKSFKKPHEPRLMKTRRDRYMHHKLELDGKTRKVHQLVAYAFIPMPSFHESWCDNTDETKLCLCAPEPQCIRHLDDDKDNNTAPNLMWGTYSQNLIDSYVNGRRPSKKHGTP